MGESRSSKRYLLVRPGDANWSVVSSLKEEKRKKTKQEEEEKKEQDIFLESGGFLDMCPAHPLNAYNPPRQCLAALSRSASLVKLAWL